MTALDLAAIGVVTLSVVFAYARGVIRSLVGSAAWIGGLVAAFAFTPAAGAMLPLTPDAPFVPYILAFVGIFIAALIAGAFIAWPLREIVSKAGMGFLDRALGAAFGLARGLAVMVAFAIVVGVTGLARADWWQNAVLAPSLASAAYSLRPWLPRAWAERLDFSSEIPARPARAPGKA